MRRALAFLLVVLPAVACGSPAGPPSAPAAACGSLRIPPPVLGTASPSSDPTPGYMLAAGSEAVGIAISGGYVWAGQTGSSRLAAIRMTDGARREYSLPFSELGFNLAVAADGRVWTAEQYRDAIAGVALDGSVRECRLAKGSRPVGVAVSPDGTLWVTESGSGALARLRPGARNFETIKLPGASQPTELLPLAEGAYVSQIAGDSLLKVSAGGEVSPIALDVAKPQAIGLLEAPDGELWVAEFGADRLARIADGQVTQVVLPAGSKPQSMVISGDHLLVTASGGNRIDSVNLATGLVTPGPKTGLWPDHLALAPDGSAWFTEYYGDRVGRVG